ncbi:MAG TPA: methylmalonyl-CoA mutase family protein [Xanthobacteraceae bacterium]|nr:methylmalonyl-CoA mutase family protein [Xanthobacteraceae bacterium]
MTELPLAAEFPTASREEWLALVEKSLHGASFDKKLAARTYDGIRIEPLYKGAEHAKAIEGRTPGTAWGVIQRLDHPDPAPANAEALHDLENGASGLAVLVAGAPSANGYGLADASQQTLARALDNVWIDAVALRLDAGSRDLETAEALIATAAERKVDLARLDATLGLDPLGTLATRGLLDATPKAAIERRAKFSADLAGRGFRARTFLADARPIHDAGGSETQELAYALACALAYWRALEAVGLSLDAGRKQIAFLLSADTDQFLTTAKFRALRKLWARIEEASGLTPAPVRLDAETAWRMMTRREPAVNWLRATIASFAAGTGGADNVTALPHAAALGLPDRFERRIARNIQLILMDESNIHRVSDPAAGSGSIEDLTSKLAAGAWKLFQEIEAAGGAAAALTSCLIQRKVAEVRAVREANVATRKDPLTGTSEFPNIHEAATAVLDVAKPAQPEIDAVLRSEALPRLRLAEPFEALRDAADRGAAGKKKHPAVFLANLGPPSAFSERASFAKNFFEAGGIEARSSEGISKSSALADAFKASGAPIACLCSSNEIYAQDAEGAAAALKKAGAKAVFLAGRAGEHEGAWRAAGIDDFVFAGCNVLTALQQVHATLGLK